MQMNCELPFVNISYLLDKVVVLVGEHMLPRIWRLGSVVINTTLSRMTDYLDAQLMPWRGEEDRSKVVCSSVGDYIGLCSQIIFMAYPQRRGTLRLEAKRLRIVGHSP